MGSRLEVRSSVTDKGASHCKESKGSREVGGLATTRSRYDIPFCAGEGTKSSSSEDEEEDDDDEEEDDDDVEDDEDDVEDDDEEEEEEVEELDFLRLDLFWVA